MHIRTRIESVMRDDAQSTGGWLRKGLSAASALYGAGVRLRRASYERGWLKTARLNCCVVSVGNLTLGGTGKTPMTIYLARLIRSYGYRVVVVSRGYRGSAEAQGGVVSDGQEMLMEASACGDEAYMMADTLKNIPVMVGRDRYSVGMEALKKFNPQVILLDDAFQHIRLARDLDIVLADAQRPFGNGRLFPRGVLRETRASLARADAVVLTRAQGGSISGAQAVRSYAAGRPLFQSSHMPFIADIVPGEKTHQAVGPCRDERGGLERLKGKQVFLFSGIARNDDFQRTVEQAGCHVQGVSFFTDHHHYLPVEMDRIKRAALKKKVDCIATTEKDFSRIAGQVNWPVDLFVVGVGIHFPDRDFDRFVERRLAVSSAAGFQ